MTTVGARVIASVVLLAAVAPAAICGTRYDDLVRQANGVVLPARDAEDRSLLTAEERRVVRFLYRELPVAGPYQYPRYAPKLIRWLKGQLAGVALPGSPDTTVGPNVNVSNQPGPQSESNITLDFLTPNFVAAASNQINVNPQGLYASSDSGATWIFRNMPLGTRGFHSDPGVAFDSLGNLYTVSLGIQPSTAVQICKSTDRGQSWSNPVEADVNGNNDKELMVCDYQAASPCRDNIYVAWDRAGVDARFTRSTDGGATFSPSSVISTSNNLIGASPAVGPGGEIYVAYADYGADSIVVFKSTSCGTSFGAQVTIANTTASFDYGIPAMCSRRVLVYPALDVDRSNGSHRGWVYVAWSDGNDGGNCPSNGGTSDVKFSRSSDGGATWSAPLVVHENLPASEQFMPWLACDPVNGDIHVMYDDTRDDAARHLTHVYVNRSTDGGATFEPSVRVSTAQTDETCCGAETGNQYGDYNGLVSNNGLSYPSWTDRRTGTDEEIYTAQINDQGGGSPPVADFVGAPLSGTAPLLVNFTDLSTGAPTSWSWTFGDGGTDTVQNPSHTYVAPGTYTVALTACNVNGCDTNTKPSYVTVTTCPAPVADFSGAPQNGPAPLAVAFTDLSTNAPTSWSWTFGDGGTSSAQNPGHTYLAAGTYTVALTAGNACGSNANTKPAYITVTGSGPVTEEIVTGAGPGASNAPVVKTWDHSAAPAVVSTWTAYGTPQYGANVASVDIIGGVPFEVVTGPGPGTVYGPQVRGFSPTGTALAKVNYYAYGTLRYGVHTGGGNVDGDAHGEILTAPGPGAAFGPHIRGWNYDNTTLTAISKISFFAYSTLKYGARVAGGDIDADAFAEIVTGAGAGAVFAPHVRAFNYDNGSIAFMPVNFFAFATGQFGACVAAGSTDADPNDEIIAAHGPDPAENGIVGGFNFTGSGVTGAWTVTAFPALGGAEVASGDLDADGQDELVAGEGWGASNPSTVTAFSFPGGTGTQLFTYAAYSAQTYGTKVASGDTGTP
ncbi:MAG: PKD domain-containing protein [Acidobacteriota bacterium]